jgi:hypothetical protein
MLTAIVIIAATTCAEAGIFGRLSVVWNGCNPCEQAACQPCEPIVCQPCQPAECSPCALAAPCDPCGTGCRPFRPLGGLLLNVKSRLASIHCGSACDPCEPVACQPCEAAVCDPCNPCDAGCGRLPFNGFFLNLKARMAAASCLSGCQPCEPVCEPCAICR